MIFLGPSEWSATWGYSWKNIIIKAYNVSYPLIIILLHILFYWSNDTYIMHCLLYLLNCVTKDFIEKGIKYQVDNFIIKNWNNDFWTYEGLLIAPTYEEIPWRILSRQIQVEPVYLRHSSLSKTTNFNLMMMLEDKQ